MRFADFIRQRNGVKPDNTVSDVMGENEKKSTRVEVENKVSFGFDGCSVSDGTDLEDVVVVWMCQEECRVLELV
ncbi:hypothetical protein J6590_044583 [Homalodisca vitripennis]|nr:hypothetical protein J6590_044583 [Homalodisca vitripennis]